MSATTVRKAILAAVFALAVFPAIAQDQPSTPLPSITQPIVPPVVIPPPTVVPGPPAVVTVAPAPAATQNTITTTAPVSSETTISVGTLAGQLLAWIVAAFSVPIGSLAVWIMVRVLKYLGITATDAMRARLQEMVVNALNISAPAVEKRLAGQGQVDIKSAVVQNAVAYVQAHGADTIKALGLDPQSGDAVEAIKARIETAIADPATPTPAVLDAPAASLAPATAKV
jgi:hypothetical protein